MSGSLMIAAGYMKLPPSIKLGLMKVADSADDGSRLGYPGLDAVRAWAGVKKSQGNQLMKDLQELGLVMQVEAGHRGRRAVFKVFPSPGDEAFSLAHKQGKPCPGADKFMGVPAIPTGDEVAALVKEMDGQRGSWNGSGAADPKAKGPAGRSQSEGSGESDPKSANGSGESDAIDGDRVRRPETKGPADRSIASGGPDPFGTSSVPKQLQELSPDASLRSTAADQPDSGPSADYELVIDPAAAVPDDAIPAVAQSLLDTYTPWVRDHLGDPLAGNNRQPIALKQSFITPALKAGYSRNVVAKALADAAKTSNTFLPSQAVWNRLLSAVKAQRADPGSGGRRPRPRYDGTHWEQAPTDQPSDVSPEALAAIFGPPAAVVAAGGR